MTRNTPPEDTFEALRRLYNCNWSQLAARIGITDRTLRNWRENGPGENGAIRLELALEAALRASGTEPNFKYRTNHQ